MTRMKKQLKPGDLSLFIRCATWEVYSAPAAYDATIKKVGKEWHIKGSLIDTTATYRFTYKDGGRQIHITFADGQKFTMETIRED